MEQDFKVLPSSTMTRIQDLRGRLIIDLLTHYGEFWKAIELLRARWNIVPDTSVPPVPDPWVGVYPWEAPIHRPTTWPAHLPPSPLPHAPTSSGGFFRDDPQSAERELLDDVNSLTASAHDPVIDLIRQTFGTEAAQEHADRVAEDEATREEVRAETFSMLWWLDLQRLHDHFVPKALWSPQPDSPWDGFFSLCLTHEPPARHLLDYAAAAPYGVMLPPDILQRPYDEADPPIPIAVNLPIVTVRDADEVEDALHEYYGTLIEHMAAALAPLGIDLIALWGEVRAAHPEMTRRLQVRRSHEALRFYIVPDEFTTEEDVIGALKFLRAQERLSNIKHRDPLTAVQIAIWIDAFREPIKDVANMMRWTLSPDEHGTLRRSSKVTEHAKEGRQILHDRGTSAAAFRPGQI